MRLSDRVLAEKTELDIQESLLQVISDLNNKQEARILFQDLLTETERLAVAKRLAIALLLSQGSSYEEIKDRLKVSSATVAKVQESLSSQGMKLALAKIQADEWAGEWAGKLTSAVSKLLGKQPA